ncbi:MAG: hypothetical protein JWO38_3454 [Gemmataceae bacterium]|nr:hypothetical protein [Gemmataceae bacterium]
MPNQRDPGREPDKPTSPYGPHRGRVDEAAGGADSSPYEATPSGEKADSAADPSTSRRQPGDSPDRPAAGR